jgi:hypothetical protein
MKLTDTQLVLLSAAAQREDGAVEIDPKLKGGAAQKVLSKLLSEHLIEEIPAEGAAFVVFSALLIGVLLFWPPTFSKPAAAKPRSRPGKPSNKLLGRCLEVIHA